VFFGHAIDPESSELTLGYSAYRDKRAEEISFRTIRDDFVVRLKLFLRCQAPAEDIGENSFVLSRAPRRVTGKREPKNMT
jgi:hypothetical protein